MAKCDLCKNRKSVKGSVLCQSCREAVARLVMIRERAQEVFLFELRKAVKDNDATVLNRLAAMKANIDRMFGKTS